MTIPVGEQYMQPATGIGKIANYQGMQADTKAAGEEIKFGQAVQVDEEVATPLTDGDFFGVAIANNFVDKIDEKDKTGIHKQGDAIAVLRKGTIWVVAGADAKSGQKAAVNTDGTFVPAATGTELEVIGAFQSTAMAGDAVMLQINLP